MWPLTKQEKYIVLFLCAVLVLGSLVHVLLAKFPLLSNVVNLIDGDALYSKLDINKATTDELEKLPYIGKYTAQNIVDYRQEHGFFKTMDEVKNVRGIKEKNFEKFKNYIVIRESK